MSRHLLLSACACAILLSLTTGASAQTGYGVDSTGNLFSFDVNAGGPIPIVAHGNLGFVPEGIDFQPGSNRLYAVDVGPITTQLYVVNIDTAVAKPATSIPSVGSGYDLTGNQHFGFDFIPNTFDGTADFLIRLVATNGANLRIHSNSGGLASADAALVIQPGNNAAFVDASAYLNNVPSTGATPTTLYDMDSRHNATYTQAGNTGVLTLLGPFGATINDAQVGIGFDIYTIPGDSDSSNKGDSGWAVLKRAGTQSGAYLLYQVDLTNGDIFGGKLVGSVGTASDFSGGFAIAPGLVPEPTALALFALGLLGTATTRRRYS